MTHLGEIVAWVDGLVQERGAGMAADESQWVRLEEAHHNDVEALSADAILHQGSKLRELTDPEGLNLEVFVPPVERAPTGYFPPEDFRLDRAGETLTCPRGATTTSRRRTSRESGWVFQFNRRDCEICPLLKLCMPKLPKLPKHKGRWVHKGEYVAEYAAVRAKAKTARYAEVRKQHPTVERKLAELVRYHGARRARFRGRGKVLLQHLMTGLVVNARRFVQLLRAPTACSVDT